MTNVKRVASWTGWCDPCETERPLVLTETGEHGIFAWLRGIGPEDRSLTLTCRVCGEWQLVPYDEADVDEAIEAPAPAPLVAVTPVGTRHVVVEKAWFRPYAIVPLPAPRARTDEEVDRALELVAEGLDLITLAS